MAEPVLIHTFKEAERGVPLSDEDVARGHLEDGWVPVLSFSSFPYPGSLMPTTGVITFFACAWPLYRIPSCPLWATEVAVSRACMWKTRLPIAEDEELVVEPVAIENIQRGMVIACEARTESPGDVGNHIAVCCGRADSGVPQLRHLGYPSSHDAHQAQYYNFFAVCKQPGIPFVFK